MTTTEQPYTYAEVKDLYENYKNDPKYKDLSWDDFIKIGESYEPGRYQRAGKPGVLKNLNVGLDKFLESTGAPEASSALFGSLLSPLGPTFEQTGQEVGRGFPRLLTNIAPMALTSEASIPLKLGGLLATSGLAGSQTYTDTNSPLAGAISGAGMAAMPLAFAGGANVASKLTPKLAEFLGTEVSGLPALVKKGIEYGGGQLGAQAALEGIGMGTEKAANGQIDWSKYVKPEYWAGQAIQQLPFAAMDVPRLFKGGSIVDSMFPAKEKPSITSTTPEVIAEQKVKPLALTDIYDAMAVQEGEKGFITREPGLKTQAGEPILNQTLPISQEATLALEQEKAARQAKFESAIDNLNQAVKTSGNAVQDTLVNMDAFNAAAKSGDELAKVDASLAALDKKLFRTPIDLKGTEEIIKGIYEDNPHLTQDEVMERAKAQIQARSGVLSNESELLKARNELAQRKLLLEELKAPEQKAQTLRRRAVPTEKKVQVSDEIMDIGQSDLQELPVDHEAQLAWEQGVQRMQLALHKLTNGVPTTPEEFKSAVGDLIKPTPDNILKTHAFLQLVENGEIAFNARVENGRIKLDLRTDDAYALDYAARNLGVDTKTLRNWFSTTGKKLVLASAWQQGAMDKMLVDPAIMKPLKNAFPVSLRQFMSNWADLRGIKGTQKEILTGLADRLGGMFDLLNEVRMGRLKGGEKAVEGAFVPFMEKWHRGAIYIRDQLGGKLTPEMEGFHILNTVGHEMYHAMKNAFRMGAPVSEEMKKTFAEFDDYTNQLSVKERGTLLKELYKTVAPKLKAEDIKALVGDKFSDNEEFQAQVASTLINSLAVEHLTKTPAAGAMSKFVESISDTLTRFKNFLGRNIYDFIEPLAKKLGMSIGESKTKKFLEIADQIKKWSLPSKELLDAIDRVDAMSRSDTDFLLTPSAPTHLQKMTQRAFEILGIKDQPTSIQHSLKEYVDDFRDSITAKEEVAKWTGGEIRPGFVDSYFSLPTILAEKFPFAASAFKMIINHIAMTNQRNNGLNKILRTDAKTGDIEETGLYHKLINTKQYREMFNKVVGSASLKDVNGIRKGTSVEDIQRMFPTASKAECVDVMNLVERHVSARLASVDLMQADAVKRQAGTLTVALMRRNENLDPQVLWQQCKQLTDSYIAAKGDVNARAVIKQNIIALAKDVKYGTSVFTTFTAFDNLLQHYSELRADKWYAPEVRTGRYVLYFRDSEGNLQTPAYNEATEASKAYKEAQAKGLSVQMFDSDRSDFHAAGLPEKYVTSFVNKESQAFESTKKLILDSLGGEERESVEKALQGYEPGLQVLKEIQARSFKKHMIKQKQVGGRETVDFVDGWQNYINSLAYYGQNMETRQAIQIELMKPELRANKELSNLISSHLSRITSANAKEWGGLKKFVFSNYMAGNISSVLIEGMQPMFSALPHLIDQSNSIGWSTKTMLDGIKAGVAVGTNDGVEKVDRFLFGPKTREKLVKLGFDDISTLEKHYKRSADEGVVNYGALDELRQTTSSSIPELFSAITGKSGDYSAGELAKMTINHVMDAGINLYSVATKQNARSMFLMGWKLGQREGLVGDALYERAKSFSQLASMTSTRTNRPGYYNLVSNSPLAHSTVSLLSTMQTYNNGMIVYYLHLAKKAFSGNAGAKKAFAVATMNQLMAAGLLGMPGAAAAMALVNTALPGVEVEKHLRDGLSTLGGEDTKLGGVISNSILHGIANDVFNIDLSPKFGLGSIYGYGEKTKITPEMILGAPGGIMKRIADGYNLFATGQIAKGLEAASPNATRNLIRLYNDGWTSRDYKNRPLDIEQSNLGKFLEVIGFTNADRTRLLREQNYQKVHDDLVRSNEQQVISGFAKDLQAGDVQGVMTRMQERQKENPALSYKDTARQVAQKIIETTFPYDIYRESGQKADIQGRMSSLQRSGIKAQPNEVQRYMMEQKIMQQLGVRQQVSAKEVWKRRMIDGLMAKGMTRQAALQAVEHHPLSQEDSSAL